MFPGHPHVPQSGEEDHSACVVVRELLDRVGDKWSVLVIALLGKGSQRFSELKRSIDGISQRMLTLTLRQLERDGLVLRTVYATVPPRVDYALTEMGASVLEPLRTLIDWAEEHGTDVAGARRRYDDAAENTKESSTATR
ncbi:MAG: Transcriptional regulator, HxlR family protein [Actinomycetia bacterium]|nr:Transcriptional regulator, HxlR family protein [Actinomycetes bacterium]